MSKKYNPLLKFGIQELTPTDTLEARLLALESKLSPTIIYSNPTVDIPNDNSKILIFSTELTDPENDIYLSGFKSMTSSSYSSYYSGVHGGVNDLIGDLCVSLKDNTVYNLPYLLHFTLNFDISTFALRVQGYCNNALSTPTHNFFLYDYDYIEDQSSKQINQRMFSNSSTIIVNARFDGTQNKIFLDVFLQIAPASPALTAANIHVKFSYY